MNKLIVVLFSVFVLCAFGILMSALIINKHESLGQPLDAVGFGMICGVVLTVVILMRWIWKHKNQLEPFQEMDMVHEAMHGPQRSYQTSVKDAILDHIRTHLGLWGNGQAIIGTSSDALLMKWVFDHEYVLEKDIAKAVHDTLCRIGREVYEWHIRLPLTRYPDHSASPEALGYALLHGAISDDEASLIRFDHGETAEEYRKMAEGLHEEVMRQLAAGETYFSIPKSSGTDHECFCC